MLQEIKKSVKGQEYVIVKSKGETYVIKFVKSGYVCRARKHLVYEGRVFDPTSLVEEKESWKPCHEVFTNNSGSTFRVVAKSGKMCKVVFDSTGYATEAHYANVVSGKIRDKLFPEFYDVAYMGLPDMSLPYAKQAQQLWQNMVRRCYCKSEYRGYQGESFVDSRWLCFENFLLDISKLDGFEGWLVGKDTGIKYNLDKDFLFPENNIYSRYTCCFIPDSFNKGLGKRDKTQGIDY